MAISIEKKHAEIYAKVADEANKASKRFSNKGYKTKPTVYEKLLNKKKFYFCASSRLVILNFLI